MKTVNIEKYLIRLDEAVEVDEALAREGWKLIIRAQGWTPVGDPEVVREPEVGMCGVIGKLVRAKVDATIRDDGSSAIYLP